MGKCTVPKLLGFKRWFDKHFGDYCEWHDLRYKATLNPFKKLWADVLFLAPIGRDIVLGVISFVSALAILPTLGTLYWAWKRGREVSRGEWKGRIR